MSYTNHISIPHQSHDIKLETNETVLESFIQAEDKTSYLVHSSQVKVKAEIQTPPKFRRSMRSSNLLCTLHCGSQHHFDYSPCMLITAHNLSNFYYPCTQLQKTCQESLVDNRVIASMANIITLIAMAIILGVFFFFFSI